MRPAYEGLTIGPSSSKRDGRALRTSVVTAPGRERPQSPCPAVRPARQALARSRAGGTERLPAGDGWRGHRRLPPPSPDASGAADPLGQREPPGHGHSGRIAPTDRHVPAFATVGYALPPVRVPLADQGFPQKGQVGRYGRETVVPVPAGPPQAVTWATTALASSGPRAWSACPARRSRIVPHSLIEVSMIGCPICAGWCAALCERLATWGFTVSLSPTHGARHIVPTQRIPGTTGVVAGMSSYGWCRTRRGGPPSGVSPSRGWFRRGGGAQAGTRHEVGSVPGAVITRTAVRGPAATPDRRSRGSSAQRPVVPADRCRHADLRQGAGRVAGPAVTRTSVRRGRAASPDRRDRTGRR